MALGSTKATNKLITRIAQQHGGRLIDETVARLFPHSRPTAEGEEPKPSFLGRMAGVVLLRVATRSVPGAIIVGGGLIAKTLYDKHQEREARLADRAHAARRARLPK